MLFVLGLALGSFVNALVWRVYAQSKKVGKKNKDLSILKGRSMCPNCKHTLNSLDLVPVLSWVGLGGKCRYCKKLISPQYPLVELVTAGLFVASYTYWPVALQGTQVAIFALWLVMLVGLMALLVYDLRWQLLPNRIMYPLSVVAGAMAILTIATAYSPLKALINVILAIVVGGGIFYALFQVSKGKWIGGGDVKLGWLLGAVVGTPAKSVLLIFLASVLGTIVSLPLLSTKKLKRTSTIPFGPFLIVGAVIAYLYGAHIIHWYQHTFLLY